MVRAEMAALEERMKLVPPAERTKLVALLGKGHLLLRAPVGGLIRMGYFGLRS